MPDWRRKHLGKWHPHIIFFIAFQCPYLPLLPASKCMSATIFSASWAACCTKDVCLGNYSTITQIRWKHEFGGIESKWVSIVKLIVRQSIPGKLSLHQHILLPFAFYLHSEICIPFRQCATVLWLTTLSNAFTHWSLHHGTIVSSRLANPARIARTAVLLPIASLARRHWPLHHSWSRRPASGKSSPKNRSKSAPVGSKKPWGNHTYIHLIMVTYHVHDFSIYWLKGHLSELRHHVRLKLGAIH